MQVSLSEKTQNVRRLEAQRNELNAKVRLLREELHAQLLQEQGSHVGEVIKPMDKKKVLVKVKGGTRMRFLCVYPKKFERLHVSYFDQIWLNRIAENIGPVAIKFGNEP